MLLKSSFFTKDNQLVPFAIRSAPRCARRGSSLGEHDENVMQIADYREEMLPSMSYPAPLRPDFNGNPTDSFLDFFRTRSNRRRSDDV